MAGTSKGGAKAAEKIKLNHGFDHYQRIGRIGGSVITENTKKKGFGTHRELAEIAGRKGGSALWREDHGRRLQLQERRRQLDLINTEQP